MKPLGCVWLIPVMLFSQVTWGETLTGKVVGLSEGDTLSVLIGENDFRLIRLAEVDCPGKGQDFNEEAKRFVENLCLGKEVTIEVTGTDANGKTLGEVTLEGKVNLNRELLRQGIAWYAPKETPDSTLVDLEAKAREAHIGLWGQADPVAPWTFRGEEPPAQPTPVSEKKDRTAKCKPEWYKYSGPVENSAQDVRLNTNLVQQQYLQRERQKNVDQQAMATRMQYGMGPVVSQLRDEIELNKAAEESAFLYGEYDPYTHTYKPGRDTVTLDKRTGVYHDSNSPWAQMLFEEDKAVMPRKEAIRRGAYPSPWDYNYYNYWGW